MIFIQIFADRNLVFDLVFTDGNLIFNSIFADRNAIFWPSHLIFTTFAAQIKETMDKNENYQLLLAQVRAIVKDETDAVANMANVAALIQETFRFWWTGFYRVVDNQLVLGPFQGSVACTRIGFGKGVCGTSWKEKRTIVVEDVEQFPGHIACSSESRSEIVVPLYKGDEVIGVLDIDSEKLATFDTTDKEWLEQIAEVVSAVL